MHGFRTATPPGLSRSNLAESADVAFDNQSFQGFWKLIFSVLRAQASHMVRFAVGCPFLLAGLLHEQEAMVLDTFRSFKRLYDGWRAAASHTSADVQAMRRRSPFNTTSMRWAVLYTEAGEWRKVTDQMREHLRALFRALGQSKAVAGVVVSDLSLGASHVYGADHRPLLFEV